MKLGSISCCSRWAHFELHGGIAEGDIYAVHVGLPQQQAGSCGFMLAGQALEQASRLMELAARGEVKCSRQQTTDEQDALDAELDNIAHDFEDVVTVITAETSPSSPFLGSAGGPVDLNASRGLRVALAATGYVKILTHRSHM